MKRRFPISLLFIVLIAAGALLFGPSATGPATPADAHALTQVRVIDGDTLRDLSANVTYRVVNIDTPETGSRAQCVAERQLGDRATQRARALVNAAQRVETRDVGRTDRYGRVVAYVVLDGRDLGETLIADGLARPWRGRREPWCDAAGGLVI